MKFNLNLYAITFITDLVIKPKFAKAQMATSIPPWCEDTPNLFDVDTPIQGLLFDRSCEWVSLNTNWRCTLPGVKTNCPATCNYCQCTNNEEKFSIGSGLYS